MQPPALLQLDPRQLAARPAVVTFTGTDSEESFAGGSVAAAEERRARVIKDFAHENIEFLEKVRKWNIKQKNAEDSLAKKIITPKFKSKCLKQLAAAQEDSISDENMKKFTEERLFETLAWELKYSFKAFSLYWNEAELVLDPNNLNTKLLAGLAEMISKVWDGLLDVNQMFEDGDYAEAAERAAYTEKLLTENNLLDDLQRDAKIVRFRMVAPSPIIDGN